MPDDLYHRDALAWSAEQADLLRRVARGEAVNGIDWGNVVEEIEDVGRSEFGAVRSYLTQVLLHQLFECQTLIFHQLELLLPFAQIECCAPFQLEVD